jgi:hypothetical protein
MRSKKQYLHTQVWQHPTYYDMLSCFFGLKASTKQIKKLKFVADVLSTRKTIISLLELWKTLKNKDLY